MASYRSLYPSKYLKVADVAERGFLDLTMESVEVETIGHGGQQERKPVVSFKNQDKGFVLNKTNADGIAAIVGSEDINDWPGHRIRLIVTKVDFSGKRVDAIRVESVPTTRNTVKPLPRGDAKPTAPRGEDSPDWTADDDSDDEAHA